MGKHSSPPSRKARRKPGSTQRDRRRAGDAGAGEPQTKGATDGGRSSKPLRLAALIGLMALLALVLWATGRLAETPRQLARQAITEHRWEDVEHWLVWAERLGPDDARNALLAARLARHRTDADTMAFELSRARVLGAEVDAIELERAMALAQAGELDMAEADLIDALADPEADAAEISDALANGLAGSGRFDEAITILLAWRDDFPEDPRVDYRLGRILEHQERYNDAEEQYRAALAKCPTFFPATFSLGRVMLNQRRVEESLEFFRSCLAMPNPAAAKIEMAVAHKSLGQGEQARRLFQEVLEKDHAYHLASYQLVEEQPEGYRAAAEYGRLESDAGNFDVALPWLKTALRNNPLDLTVRYSLGVTLRGLGQQEQAEREFEHVRAAREAMGVANALNERIRRDPKDVEARYELGKLILEHESERVGLYWLRSIFSFQPDYEPAHRLLADYYGDKAETDPSMRARASYHRGKADMAAAASQTGSPIQSESPTSQEPDPDASKAPSSSSSGDPSEVPDADDQTNSDTPVKG